MNESDCILWTKRRTVGWLNLSLAARGAAEGLVVALDEHGELRLGKNGLEGLALLLVRPWPECEPAVLELLEHGRFVHDVQRGVLLDPQYLARQAPRLVVVPPPAASAPVVDARPLTPTERSRNARARRAAEAATQLELPVRDTPMQRDATACNVAPLHADVASIEIEVMPQASPATSQRCNSVASDSPSLSDLKISKKSERGAATLRDVVQRDATLGDESRTTFADACRQAGVELCVDFVWKKFAAHAYAKRWRLHELHARWAKWVLDEVAWTQKREQRATRSPGLALARPPPDSRPILAERVQWQLEAQAQRPEVLAAAARAMAVFG